MSFNEIAGVRIIAIPGTKGITKTFCYSLLTFCIANAVSIQAAVAAESSAADSDTRKEQSLVVTAETSDDSTSSPAQAYTVPATRAGTKLNLTQRDIPQSVSVLTQQADRLRNITLGQIQLGI